MVINVLHFLYICHYVYECRGFNFQRFVCFYYYLLLFVVRKRALNLIGYIFVGAKSGCVHQSGRGHLHVPQLDGHVAGREVVLAET